jgi:uroporphyrinogen-III synthase
VRLIVTRPEPDAQRTAAVLRARGHHVLLAPLSRFEPIADADPGDGPWAGLLVTSANAVRAMVRHAALPSLVKLPLMAVGRHTAESAREAGFETVASAGGAAADLADLAVRRFPGTSVPLLYLAGEDRAADLEGALAQRGVPVRTVAVYRIVAAKALPSAVAVALSSRAVDGVLHYSRRSADTYLRCSAAGALRAAALVPCHFCLSRDVAAPLLGAGARKVHVAAQPDAAALLDLVDHAPGLC